MGFSKTMFGQINGETSIWSGAIVLGVVQVSPPTKRHVVFYRWCNNDNVLLLLLLLLLLWILLLLSLFLYIIKKMINIAIYRATYYIFCCRNRNWDSSDLTQFWFSFLFFFFFQFFFWIIQSQAAFVNCLYVARFTIVHSKTQIKFPLLYCMHSSLRLPRFAVRWINKYKTLLNVL